MGKAIVDPLFLFLALALAAQILLYRHWRRLGGWARTLLLALTVGTGVLWAFGTHVVESHLVQRLNAVYPIPSAEQIASIDVVVVLSSGFVEASEAAYDQLDPWGSARVIQGVRTFFASDARLLVMSGRLSWGDPSRMVSAMKELAVAMGVPEEDVILEPNAANTREHPIELSILGIVAGDETVAVVTSSWHLPRAMAEFKKHFSHLVAIPAFETAIYQQKGLLAWMPRSRSLANSTRVLAEYIGMIWYLNPLL